MPKGMGIPLQCAPHGMGGYIVLLLSHRRRLVTLPTVGIKQERKEPIVRPMCPLEKKLPLL